jgi:hypothetical protein
MERQPDSETFASLKNLTVDKVPKKKIASVNFSCAVLSVWNFLIPEDGTDRLFQNNGKELPLYTA